LKIVKEEGVPGDKHTKVLRILDDQNKLVERADTKAISLLSTLGIFTVFFIAHFNNIPINTVSIILLGIYFVGVLTSIFHIIMAISPRIHSKKSDQAENIDESTAYQPTFFAGISRFADVSAYKKRLDDLLSDEPSTTDIYIQQIYEIAKINTLKYKYVQRAVWLVIITLTAQLTLIIVTFANRLLD
jgi:hypothetical protein